MLVEGEMTRNRMIEIVEREMCKNGSRLTADTPTWNAVTVARDSEHEDGCLTSLLRGVYDEGAEAARKEGYDMARFRKRPVVPEASRWWKNGDHPDDGSVDVETGGFLTEGKVVRRYRHPDVPGGEVCKQCGYIMHEHGWIDTPEGGHTVCPGDWIITGVKGEFYPIKDDIFRERTYANVLD